MSHSSVRIANDLLNRAGPQGLDPMKLLKLTYLCQGWMLGLYREPLIWTDVEAWRYGPVFREIYKHVGGHRVISAPIPTADQDDPLSHRESHLINQVWQKYGGLSGLHLSALTHQDGSPWDKTYQTYGQNAVIPKRVIEDYYAEMAARGGKA